MAKLASGNLSIEIRFVELDRSNWIQYEIFFLYKDQPMIQDKLVKRVNLHLSKHSLGAFRANEDADGDAGGLIDTLRNALQTEEMQYYVPIEPDFIFAVYPDMAFPFMGSRYIRVWKSEEAQRAEKQQEEDRAAAGGKLPYDLFTVIMMVDVYNFDDEFAYSGEGPAIIMVVTRMDLLKFLEDYEHEFNEFCRIYGLAETEAGE